MMRDIGILSSMFAYMIFVTPISAEEHIETGKHKGHNESKSPKKSNGHQEKEEHDHDHEEPDNKKKDDHDEDSEHGHEGKDDHGKDEHKGEHKEHSEESGHHDDHEEKSAKFGPGKAILAVRDEGKSFKLSDESAQFLELKFSSPKAVQLTGIEKNSVAFEVPFSSLVFFQTEKGIYIREDGWIELVHVKIIKRNRDIAIVQSKGLSLNREIAIHGVAFLRAAELEASGQGGEGHAH